MTWNRSGPIINIKHTHTHTLKQYISSADSFVPDPPITANRPRRQSPKRNFFSSICSARRNSNVSGISPSYARRFPSINQTGSCAYPPSCSGRPWLRPFTSILRTERECLCCSDRRFSAPTRVFRRPFGNFPSLAIFLWFFFLVFFFLGFISFCVCCMSRLVVTRSNVIKLRSVRDARQTRMLFIRFNCWWIVFNSFRSSGRGWDFYVFRIPILRFLSFGMIHRRFVRYRFILCLVV